MTLAGITQHPTEEWMKQMARNVKQECLSRLILFGEVSLKRALAEFVAHYHRERNHQGKGNLLLFPKPLQTRARKPIKCTQRLGGLLKCTIRPHEYLTIQASVSDGGQRMNLCIMPGFEHSDSKSPPVSATVRNGKSESRPGAGQQIPSFVSRQTLYSGRRGQCDPEKPRISGRDGRGDILRQSKSERLSRHVRIFNRMGSRAIPFSFARSRICGPKLP